MGKIKSKMVKRSARELTKKGVIFNGSFGDNKKVLGMTMPSKKIRNQMAGYLAKLNKK
ncbi:MAG: 30S ribosomal protein S17e [Nanoarchaeota archaeon]